MDRTEFVWAGAPGVGVLRARPGPVSIGVVTLHGASTATVRQPMFEHLAMTLVPHGAAVLGYDRRSPVVALGGRGWAVQATVAVG